MWRLDNQHLFLIDDSETEDVLYIIKEKLTAFQNQNTYEAPTAKSISNKQKRTKTPKRKLSATKPNTAITTMNTTGSRETDYQQLTEEEMLHLQDLVLSDKF